MFTLVRFFKIVAIGVLTAAARMAEGQYVIGDKVVVIADSELKVEGRKSDDVWPGLVMQVSAVNHRWLWVSHGKPGWLDAAYVIPLDRRAIHRLTEMIAAEPRQARLYTGRALVWQALGELDIALVDLNEAIRLDPSAVGYSNRGNAWRAKREYDKAIADYDEALRLNPKCAPAYGGRGLTWQSKLELDKAIADYDAALRLDPKNGFYYHRRGGARTFNGELDKALADYGEALRLDPKDAHAYRSRGTAWQAKGAYDNAVADYSAALLLDPKDAYSKAGRAWIRATCPEERHRNGQQAVADAIEACELTQYKIALYLGTLAAAYAESGDLSKAVKWQVKAIAAAAEGEKSNYHSVLKLYKSGKRFR